MFLYNLVYNSKTDAILDLKKYGVLDNNGDVSDYNISVIYIGTITKTPELRDGENKLISTAEYLDGYHINIVSSIELKLNDNHLVYPTNPKYGIF